MAESNLDFNDFLYGSSDESQDANKQNEVNSELQETEAPAVKQEPAIEEAIEETPVVKQEPIVEENPAQNAPEQVIETIESVTEVAEPTVEEIKSNTVIENSPQNNEALTQLPETSLEPPIKSKPEVINKENTEFVVTQNNEVSNETIQQPLEATNEQTVTENIVNNQVIPDNTVSQEAANVVNTDIQPQQNNEDLQTEQLQAELAESLQTIEKQVEEIPAEPATTDVNTVAVETAAETTNETDLTLEDEILNSLKNLPDEKPTEEKQLTFEELAKANQIERGEPVVEEKKEETPQQEEVKQEETPPEEVLQEEEDEILDEDEKSIIEKKRQQILSKQVKSDENIQKVESIAGDVKKLEDIDLESIDYSEFDKINEEHIDLFYLLNDTKANPEFLDEDLLAQSKKEEAIREAKRQEKQDMDFELEALVDNNVVKVDLTGIIDDLETGK